MSKLIYLDTFSYSSFHEDFNASSLKMFSGIYNRIDYYATSSSREAVEKLLGGLPENVGYHRICEIRDGGSFRNALRHLFSAFTDILFVLFSHRDTVVYINYNSLWGLRSIARISERRGIKVIQQCHGELEFLFPDKKLNFLSEISLTHILDGFFGRYHNLFFCVLGSSILGQLKFVLDESTFSRFLSFEHTCIRTLKYKAREDGSRCSPKIRLAVIGCPAVSKGINDFLKLSNMLDRGKYQFFSLGRIGKMKDIFDDNGIEYIPGTESSFADKKVMQAYIADMDAILFFYPNDLYKLTASGALIDAIASGKPILAYHNSYFDPFFKKYGIGRLFNNLDELYSFLMEKDKEQIAALRTAGTDFISPDYEAEIFRGVLAEKDIIQ